MIKVTHFVKKQKIELIAEERDANKNIVKWKFLIDEIEEMSSGISEIYKKSFLSLYNFCLPFLLRNQKNNFLTIGGADYQLSEVFINDKILNKKSDYIMVDPLAGQLKEIYGLVDKKVSDSSFAREIPLTFNQFFEVCDNEYNSYFTFVLVDVSDFEDENSVASEIYTDSFFMSLSTLLSNNSFIIMYEGENKEVFDKINIPKSFIKIKEEFNGYGFFSLWEFRL